MKVLAGRASTLILCTFFIALLLPPPRPALADYTGLALRPTWRLPCDVLPGSP